MPAPDLAAATDVLRAYLESTGRFAVVPVASPGPPGAEPGALDAASAAREAGAAFGVTLRVSRLGTTLLARTAVYGLDGALVHSDEMGASGADDLDPVLRRLAEGISRGERGQDLAEIDTVTRKEARRLAKMRSSYSGGLRLGALVPYHRADPASRTGVAGGLGFVGFFDSRTWLADVSLEAYVSDADPTSNPDRAFYVATGLYLPLLRGDTAPYVGGALAFGYSRLGGDRGGSGLSARATAGLLLGRLSHAAFRLEWSFFWNLYDERERGTGLPVRTSGGAFSFVVVGG